MHNNDSTFVSTLNMKVGRYWQNWLYEWLQGPYAAIGMTGITAVYSQRTAAVANCSAELIRLGWGVSVSRGSSMHAAHILQGSICPAVTYGVTWGHLLHEENNQEKKERKTKRLDASCAACFKLGHIQLFLYSLGRQNLRCSFLGREGLCTFNALLRSVLGTEAGGHCPQDSPSTERTVLALQQSRSYCSFCQLGHKHQPYWQGLCLPHAL